MPFLTSWGRTPTAAKTGTLGGATIATPHDAVYPAQTYPNWAREAYGRNEIVYSCITEKATSVAEAPLTVTVDAGEDGEVEQPEHPLARLVADPNQLLSSSDLMELVVLYLDLAGVAFIEKVRSRGGDVVELWPLRPDLVRFAPRAGQPGRLDYWYDLGNGRLVPLGEDVIHLRYPNPVDLYLGTPPLRPALRSTVVDNEATDFTASLLQNGAMPGAVITTEKELNNAQHARMKARWEQAYSGRNRGRAAFLQKGMDIQTLGLNLRDLEFPDLRRISETRICSVFGVPPILIGAAAGLERSTFANYAEARTSFWHETVIPLQKRIATGFARSLLPDFGQSVGDVKVGFDRSGVPALQEDGNEKWGRATKALAAGAITLNRFLAEVGDDPVDGGDVFLIPNKVKVVPVDQLGKAADQSLAAPTSDPADDTDDPDTDDTDADDTDAEDTDDAKGYDPLAEHAAQAEVFKHLHLGRRTKADDDTTGPTGNLLAAYGRAGFADGYQGKFAALARTILGRHRADTLDAVDAGAKNEPADEKVVARILNRIEAAEKGWIAHAQDEMQPLMVELTKGASTLAAAELGRHFDLNSDDAAEFARGYSYDFAAKVSDTTVKGVRKVVVDSLDQGLSIREMKAALGDLYAGWDTTRTEMIARTETIRAANFGAKHAYLQAGVSRIEWVAAADGCAYCVALNGKTVETAARFLDPDEQFQPEGASRPLDLSYTGGLDAPPAHPKCRCAVVAAG